MAKHNITDRLSTVLDLVNTLPDTAEIKTPGVYKMNHNGVDGILFVFVENMANVALEIQYVLFAAKWYVKQCFYDIQEDIFDSSTIWEELK